MRGNVLAIDIGGSKILVGVVDNCGNIKEYTKITLPDKYSVDFLIGKICEMSERFMKFSPCAAGVNIPGLADSENGMWKYAPFSGISEIPIADILKKKLGLDIYIENDVNSCAVGEKMYGECKDDSDFLWVTVSNGIGGALYINGELYKGTGGNAGEIGHFIVEETNGNLCGCENCGCLEAMASGKGIEKEYYKLTDKKLTAKEISRLAYSGDVTAKGVFERAGFYIGKALSYCVNILNIKKIIIGGGVSQSFDLLENGIYDAFDKYVFRQANKEIIIKKTGLGYMAALTGAAAIAQKGTERM